MWDDSTYRMYWVKEKQPRYFDAGNINIWPPAPPIVFIGALRAGQMSAEKEMVADLSIDGWGNGQDEVKTTIEEAVAQYGHVYVGIAESDSRYLRLGFWVNRA